MKLFVTDHGDPSVGLFSQTWEVDCPFNREDLDGEGLNLFKTDIKKLYKEFANGKVTAEYEFEVFEAHIEEYALDYMCDQSTSPEEWADKYKIGTESRKAFLDKVIEMKEAQTKRQESIQELITSNKRNDE